MINVKYSRCERDDDDDVYLQRPEYGASAGLSVTERPTLPDSWQGH